MNKFLLPLLALALAGCAAPRATRDPATGLVPAAARISDGRIQADRQTLAAVQLRLRRLNESGIPQSSYPLAKAQCWLDSANTQYEENDRTGYIEESLGEAMKIIQALEADRNAAAGADTPLVAGSTRLREDLWAKFAALRSQQPTLACTARSIACGEVRLVRAGHAEQQTGWRAATPHIQLAEDALRRAEAEAASCAQPVAARAAPVAAPPPPPPPPRPLPPVVVTREAFTVLGDTLFKFNKSSRKDMLPGGLQTLNMLAERLKSYKTIDTLGITGHTDRLGSESHNDKLSQARAETVRDYLIERGVKAGAISAQGVGSRAPVTTGCSARASKARQIQCLQPDRRVTVESTGTAR